MKRRVQLLVIPSLLIAGMALLVSGFFSTEKPTRKYTERTEFNMAQEASYHGALETYKMLYGNPKTGEVNMKEIHSSYQEAKSKRFKSAAGIGMNWQFLGPSNQGGRTRAFIVDNENSDRLYAGATTGGLWLSDNGGNTWAEVKNIGSSMVLSCAAQAPNGDLYFGTGSQFDGGGQGWGLFPGGGIYKSTDRGETWSVLEETVPEDKIDNRQSGEGAVWNYVNDIIADPKNSDNVFAATTNGLMASDDGGATWEHINVVDNDLPVLDQAWGQSLDWTGDDQRLLVGLSQGHFMYSDTPFDSSSYEAIRFSGTASWMRVAGANLVQAGGAVSSKVYVITVSGSNPNRGQLDSIYVSENKGEDFQAIKPHPPEHTTNWELFGTRGQGDYDLAIGVNPVNEDHVFFGGVQLWQFNGNWTRVAVEGGGVGNPFYVHADKHDFVWDSNNPSTMYVLTDGGISRSEDGGETFYDVNRNYQTTQFYGVGFSKNGMVFGGTQDNGVFALDPTGNFFSGNSDFGQNVRNQGILNGDGFDVEVSNLVDLKFTTAQYGNLGRSQIDGTRGAGICNDLCDDGPFWSVHRLWETLDDPYSQDSVVFEVDTFQQRIAIGSGVKRSFSGTLVHDQEAASIIYESVYFVSGNSVIRDSDGDGVYTGAGTASVNKDNGAFSVNFTTAPTSNSPVYAYFTVSYEEGDEIELFSNTNAIPFYYTLKKALNPEDEIKVQDPIQSAMAMALGNNINGIPDGVAVARGVLNVSSDVQWIDVTKSGSDYNSGEPNCFEFSHDGNHLFVGTEHGHVTRISNLSALYRRHVLDTLIEVDTMGDTTFTINIDNGKVNDIIDVQVIWNGDGGKPVTGMSMHPDNSELMVITVGGWTGEDSTESWVYMIDNAVSAQNQGQANVVSKQGNLPPMPVFDAEIDVRAPRIVLLGTAFGVYSTTNIFANDVAWADENSSLQNTPPVYDVRQQRLGWTEATNHETYYIGTFGRGIWKSDALVSARDDIEHTKFDNDDFVADFSLYPNPVLDYATFDIEVSENTVANLRVMDLQGKVVKSYNNSNLSKGNNTIRFPAYALSTGTYIAVLDVNGVQKVAKFVKR